MRYYLPHVLGRIVQPARPLEGEVDGATAHHKKAAALSKQGVQTDNTYLKDETYEVVASAADGLGSAGGSTANDAKWGTGH